jgi:hypothetical protein
MMKIKQITIALFFGVLGTIGADKGALKSTGGIKRREVIIILAAVRFDGTEK